MRRYRFFLAFVVSVVLVAAGAAVLGGCGTSDERLGTWHGSLGRLPVTVEVSGTPGDYTVHYMCSVTLGPDIDETFSGGATDELGNVRFDSSSSSSGILKLKLGPVSGDTMTARISVDGADDAPPPVDMERQ